MSAIATIIFNAIQLHIWILFHDKVTDILLMQEIWYIVYYNDTGHIGRFVV